MAKAVLGAEHIVADEVMLLLDLAYDRVGTTNQGQAIVDPEIVGLRPFPEDPAQLKALLRTGFPSVHAVRPVSAAGPRNPVLCRGAESGLRHTRRRDMLGGLGLRLGLS